MAENEALEAICGYGSYQTKVYDDWLQFYFVFVEILVGNCLYI